MGHSLALYGVRYDLFLNAIEELQNQNLPLEVLQKNPPTEVSISCDTVTA